MSNYKSNLQSNNEALSANNLDLQRLIEQANALPDAGGGTIDNVIGTVNSNAPVLDGLIVGGVVHYIDENGTYCTSNILGSIKVQKDSILYASSGNGVRYSGDIVLLYSDGSNKVFHIIGDFTITI